MTEPEIDYGERLRRALHATADSVVPSGDGLDRIRHRIAQEQARDRASLRWLVRWLQFAVLERFAPPGGWRWPVLTQGWWRPRLPQGRHPLALIASLRRLRLPEVAWRPRVPDWLRLRLPDGSPRFTVPAALRQLTIPESLRGLVLSDHLRRLKASDGLRTFPGGLRRLKVPAAIRRAALPGGWMRPVLATTGAVIVAVVAVLAIPALRQSVIPSANSTSGPGSPQKGQGSVTGHSGTGPAVIPSTGSSSPYPTPAATGSRSSSAAPTKCPSTSGTVTPRTSVSSPRPPCTKAPPSTNPSPSPSPTPTTPTPTPTPTTPTPTDTPTDTSSSVPGGQTSAHATDSGSASP